MLMLLEPSGSNRRRTNEDALNKLLRALPAATRDTDITGWYKDRSILGVICTEIGVAENKTIENALLAKVATVLYTALSTGEVNEVRLTFQVFPEAGDGRATDDATVFTLYRDLMWNNRQEERLAINEAFDLKAT